MMDISFPLSASRTAQCKLYPDGTCLHWLALKSHHLLNTKTGRKGQETEGGGKLASLNQSLRHTYTHIQEHTLVHTRSNIHGGIHIDVAYVHAHKPTQLWYGAYMYLKTLLKSDDVNECIAHMHTCIEKYKPIQHK